MNLKGFKPRRYAPDLRQILVYPYLHCITSDLFCFDFDVGMGFI